VPVYCKKVFVEIVIATLHIVFLQFLCALHCATPANHEIGAKLFAFFISETAVKITVFAIKPGHLIAYV
jgi:hypothetical protein